MDYIKAMFGIHAMHLPCQVLLQDQGKTPSGLYLAVGVVIVSSPDPILSETARNLNAPHELVVGDMVLRPHGKWTGREYVGHGLAGLATSSAMFPDGWINQSLDNGYRARQR